MPAKIFYQSVRLPHKATRLSFEELLGDAQGNWLEPNVAEFADFLPLLAFPTQPSALPPIFRTDAPPPAEKETLGYPFSHENPLPLTQSAIGVHNVRQTQVSSLLTDRASPVELGKYAAYFPFQTETEAGKLADNITDEALKYIRSFYTKKLEKNAKNSSEETLNQTLHEALQHVIRDSKHLPVIHKFSLQLFDLLPRTVREKIDEKKITAFHKILDRYGEKLHLLKASAQERKVLFERLEQNLALFEDALLKIGKQRAGWEEWIENARGISKEEVYLYVYAVLHHRGYRQTFAANLKRELPRIPLCNDFFRWVGFGERLAQLHLGGAKDVQISPPEIPDEPLPTRLIGKLVEETKALQVGNGWSVSLPASVWIYPLGEHTLAQWIQKEIKVQKHTDMSPELLLHVAYRIAYVCALSEVTAQTLEALSHLPL